MSSAGGQAFGYIHFAIVGWAAGVVLAYGGQLARTVPDLLIPAAGRREHVVAEIVFALVVWLPLAWRAVRSQARSLALAEGLPATTRPGRAATLVTLGALALFAALEWVTGGKWGSGPFNRWHGGYAPIAFHISLPILAWISIRLSLGGARLKVSQPASEALPATQGPRFAPAPPGPPIPAGPDRDLAAVHIAGVDAVAARFPDSRTDRIPPEALAPIAAVADRLLADLDAVVRAGGPPGSMPMSLRTNLLTYGIAIADAIRLARTAQDPSAGEARERIGERYRGGAIVASSDLELVLAVAREARASAAAEAGLERQDARAR